jgi:CheY-like chemotaxis protein
MLAVEQKPDFIILDFSMPMLSGIQAAAEILIWGIPSSDQVGPGIALRIHE